jgi:hypothetical protein
MCASFISSICPSSSARNFSDAEEGGSGLSHGFFPMEDYRLIPEKTLKCFNLQQYTPRLTSLVTVSG